MFISSFPSFFFFFLLKMKYRLYLLFCFISYCYYYPAKNAVFLDLCYVNLMRSQNLGGLKKTFVIIRYITR